LSTQSQVVAGSMNHLIDGLASVSSSTCHAERAGTDARDDRAEARNYVVDSVLIGSVALRGLGRMEQCHTALEAAAAFGSDVPSSIRHCARI
jgi:hypothetical protein